MKKFVLLFLSALIIVLFSGCGSIFVSLDTPKSDELSSKYDYYLDSIAVMSSDMNITPEQADEVFIILTSIGLDDKVKFVHEKKDSKTDKTYYSVVWGGKTFDVYLKDGVVEKVTSDLDMLYPEEKLHNVLMDTELKVKDIKNGFGNSVVGQYAYIRVPSYQLEKVTDYNLKEFAEKRVDGSGYNWVSIFLGDDKGICFVGSSKLFASYGKIDSDGTIIEEMGVYSLNEDDNFVYTEIK